MGEAACREFMQEVRRETISEVIYRGIGAFCLRKRLRPGREGPGLTQGGDDRCKGNAPFLL